MDRTFLLHSCGAVWLPTYKLGLLELTGSDPLNPEAWRKHPKPVFQSSDFTFGVGHSCFVSTGRPASWWHIYHAKRHRAPGWPRSIYLQSFQFDESGFPTFGSPLPLGSKLPKPVEGTGQRE